MSAQSVSPRVIVSAVTDSLRGFQRLRGERRSYAAESYAGPTAAAAPEAQPAKAPPSPRPGEPAEDSPFRPRGFVEMNGHAIPVMDPAFLQALQAQVAQGAVPPAFLLADLMGGRTPGMAAVDPQAAAAVHGVTDPENMPAPAPTVAAPSQDESNPRTDAVADEAPDEKRAPAAPERLLAQLERLFQHRADDEAARLGALLREHEERLAQQAEAMAKMQAALLREVLGEHRNQQAAQASQHAQVIRDLLREHQNQLDEHATAAVTREAQAIGTLLREHSEALTEVHEAHRQGLEEILESHRDELQAARGDDDKLLGMLAEQAKQQQAAHLQLTSGIAALTAVVQRLGEKVQGLVDHAAERADLSWLPPPSFPPPVVPKAAVAAAPAISPPQPTYRTAAPVGSDDESAAPAASRPSPRVTSEAEPPPAVASSSAQNYTDGDLYDEDVDEVVDTRRPPERSSEPCRPTT